MNRWYKDWRYWLLGGLLVGFYAWVGCPYRYFLGWCCPGCGMTRAWWQVLIGDFHLAWYYHPLWWLVLVVVIYIVVAWWFKRRLPWMWELGLIVIVGIGFVVVYCYRLWDHSPVVYWDWSRGVIAQWLMR